MNASLCPLLVLQKKTKNKKHPLYRLWDDLVIIFTLVLLRDLRRTLEEAEEWYRV